MHNFVLKSIQASTSSRFCQIMSRKIVIVLLLFDHYSIHFNTVIMIYFTLSYKFHLYRSMACKRYQNKVIHATVIVDSQKQKSHLLGESKLIVMQENLIPQYRSSYQRGHPIICGHFSISKKKTLSLRRCPSLTKYPTFLEDFVPILALFVYMLMFEVSQTTEIKIVATGY